MRWGGDVAEGEQAGGSGWTLRHFLSMPWQVVPPALSRADDPTHPGSLFRQFVSEDEDSTPSLFKLGWLSSMTK